MSEKTPLELRFEIRVLNKPVLVMYKKLYANFTPLHGMEIVDDGLVFEVRTLALAGLSGITHVAYPKIDPDHRTLVGDFESVRKTKVTMSPAGKFKSEDDWMTKAKSTLEEYCGFWKKLGWVVEAKNEIPRPYLPRRFGIDA